MPPKTVDLQFHRPENFNINDIGRFVAGVGILIFVVALLAFFLYMVWGGAEWLTSGGDKAKIQSGRDRIMHALIGLSILALTVAVIKLVETFLGVVIIGNTNPIPRGY